MKYNRKTTLSLSLVAALAIGAATASAVNAGGNHGTPNAQFSQDSMMGNQGGQFGHGGNMGNQGGQFGHGGNMGNQGGMMGGQDGMMGGFTNMLDLDADGNGTATPEEVRAGLQALLVKYDTNGDGSLSLSEFEGLHSATIREQMVDGFQMLDNDGDGQVTADEMTAPADRMETMMNFQAGQTGANGMGAGADTMMQNQNN